MDVIFKSVDLQSTKNQLSHKTNGLSSSTLVLRRGQAFQILVTFDGRAFDSRKDKLIFQLVLGPLSLELPLTQPATGSTSPSTTQWSATLERGNPSSPRTISVSLYSPPTASVGVYTLSLKVQTTTSAKTYSLGQFTLLCNPWSQGDSVFLNSDELREEYVRSDYGVLYRGTPRSIAGRPWSFGQYENGILDICMRLLQRSTQYLTDKRKDLLNRSNPVYIGRVISAMINSNDDRGVVIGNWSGEYADGVNPSQWSGSADILKKWFESGPVKYGQCWVFAAVMCTVMRALGIPTRVVTNFNSAHDTDGNMVIEEYYSEFGEKLSYSRDSIWNFHVWVESWMKRPDLGEGFNGWQVLDPTPQERSGGLFRCGPASLKAIYEKTVTAQYDVPFVYAEVNADVRTIIVRDGKVLKSSTDTKRVGALICTKRPGSTQMQVLTSEYKTELDALRTNLAIAGSAEDPSPSRMPGASAGRVEDSSASRVPGLSAREVPKNVSVSLSLEKTPVIGENIIFNVNITNGPEQKKLKVHVNAQNKMYNRNPTGTFWEAHNDLKLSPNGSQTFKHEISFKEYSLKELREEYMVNLAVVVEDVETGERIMDSDEFNITSPTLSIQIANENSVTVNTQQVATVSFTSHFTIPVNGELTVTGSGLLEEKVQMSVTLKPGETLRKQVQFTPRMTGSKMLLASLELKNLPSVLHGFKTINVK